MVDGTGAAGVADLRIADGLITEIGPGLTPAPTARARRRWRDRGAGLHRLAPRTSTPRSSGTPPATRCPSMVSPRCSSATARSLSHPPPEQRDRLKRSVRVRRRTYHPRCSPRQCCGAGRPSRIPRRAALPCTVNVATQVGHTRCACSSWVMARGTAPPHPERRTMARCSTGRWSPAPSALDLVVRRGRTSRPTPSVLADDDELGELLDVLVDQAFLSSSPTSRRAWRDDVAASPRLTRTAWSHVDVQWDLLRQRPARTDLGDPRHMASCRPTVSRCTRRSHRRVDMRVNWYGGMSFYGMATTWHRFVQGRADEKRAMLTSPEWRRNARAEWDATKRTMFPHRFPERVRLVEVHDPALEPWVGRTLAELIADRGGHPSDVLADWLLENDLEPGAVRGRRDQRRRRGRRRDVNTRRRSSRTAMPVPTCR